MYLGGLKIYSAVDTSIQKQMEYVYYNRITFPNEEDNDDAIQSAMVVMDFKGRVMGMVGQLGKKKGNRVQNYAVSDPRQPGSSWKPLSVYAPAIDSGSLYWSSYFPNYGIKGVLANRSAVWPSNYGGNYGDPTDRRNFAEAIAPSLNTIPARIVQTLGVDYCYSYLRDKFHMSTLDEIEDRGYPSLAIGAMQYGTTPLDMAAAYAVFCNGGYYYKPYVYYKVEDANGKVILDGKSEGEQVLNTGTADVMIHLLRNVVTASNGTARAYAVNNQYTFAKSGTTSDNKDKWLVGGTAYYVAAAWSGFKYRKTINTYYYGSNPSGSVFKEVMNRIHDGLPYKDFEFSGDAVQRTFCRISGNLASSSCSYTGVGWYRVDALPPRCSSHAGYIIPAEETTKKKKEETTTKKPETTTKKPETTTKKPDLTTLTPVPTEPPVEPSVSVAPITDPPVVITEPPATAPVDEPPAEE